MCKLVKALYGLKWALRAWYEKLREVLVQKGFKNSLADTSLFAFINKEVTVYMLVYVDDILLTRTNSKLI